MTAGAPCDFFLRRQSLGSYAGDMAPLLTDEEVEALLAPRTRPITMPDGRRRPMTMMQIHWNAYDYLMRTTSCTDAWLAELSLEEEAETGTPFHICFPETVALMRKLYDARRGDLYEHRHNTQAQGAIRLTGQDIEASADAAHILRGTPPSNPFWQGRA